MKKLPFFLFVMLLCIGQGVSALNYSKSVMWPNGKPVNYLAPLVAPTVNFVDTCEQLANGYLLASFSSDVPPTFAWTINGNPVTGSTEFLDSSEIVNLSNGDTVGITVTNPSGNDNDSVIINCPVNVKVRFFIEGPYIGSSTMTSILSNQGATTINPNITDMVTVELRDASMPHGIIASSNKHVSTTGYVDASFAGVANGSYYIAIKHRSAVQTWSASPVAIALMASNSYDFSTANTKAYGNNMVNMGSGVWAFYTADINQDEAVDNSDDAIFTNDLNNFVCGWYASDLNGDGCLDNADAPYIVNNIMNSIFSDHP